MSTAASSTMDYICIGSVLMDMRLKLIEDSVEESKEQMSSVFSNLEACFDYLKKLHEGVNSKATAAAVSGLDRSLRAMAREFVKLGPSHDAAVTGRKDGPLTGSKLCKSCCCCCACMHAWEQIIHLPPSRVQYFDRRIIERNYASLNYIPETDWFVISALLSFLSGESEFWSLLLGDPDSTVQSASPPPAAAAAAGMRTRPATARMSSRGTSGGGRLAGGGTSPVAAHLSPSFGAFSGGVPFPPPNFMREKRDIRVEQERLIAFSSSSQQETARRSPRASMTSSPKRGHSYHHDGAPSAVTTLPPLNVPGLPGVP